MKHDLKTWLEPFAAVADGTKRYEVRKEDDRTYRVGDMLYLREWNQQTKEYTGRAIEARVLYMTRGPAWDIPEGMVVMSIATIGDIVENTWPADQDDPEVTRDLLALVSVDVPVEVVAAWSHDQRRQADDWASSKCLESAGDGRSLQVPDHLSEFVRDR